MAVMQIRRWRYFDFFGCVQLDPKTGIPIPGADGQPQPRRFPQELQIGRRVGSAYGGVEIINSPYNHPQHSGIINDLLVHAFRIAPFAEFLVGPAFRVFWLDGKGSATHDGTVQILELEDRGLYVRTVAAVFQAGENGQATRTAFWKSLLATVMSEIHYQNGWAEGFYLLAHSADGAMGSAHRTFEAMTSNAEILAKKGAVSQAEADQMWTIFKEGAWSTFSYLWCLYADAASEKSPEPPSLNSPDHEWFFYRTFLGLTGESVMNFHPGSYFSIEDVALMRKTYMAPVHEPKPVVKPKAVRPVKTGNTLAA